MHVFVTGGSGQTGPAIVAELISAGHSLTGLARSDESAARLEALGAVPHLGSLEELDCLERGAKGADGVVHMAFGGDYADPQDLIRRDCNAIEALGRALAGSGKPLVSTSGTLVVNTNRVTTEQDPPNPDSIAAFRIPGEQACLRLADETVRSSVVRLAPTVHGPGDYGFIPALIAAARRNGRSAYIGWHQPLAGDPPPRRGSPVPPRLGEGPGRKRIARRRGGRDHYPRHRGTHRPRTRGPDRLPAPPVTV